jgi:ribonuclease BN (tRNA processing enzyme)
MAQAAGVKKLVLVHMGPGLSAQEPFYHANLAMQRIYQGDIIFSEELLKIDL